MDVYIVVSGKFIKIFAHLARTSTTKMNHKLFFQNNKSASLLNNLLKKSFIQLLKKYFAFPPGLEPGIRD